MTEDKKVITIDEVEYTEDQLSEQAKVFINHVQVLDQKISSAAFNLDQLQGGREFFLTQLRNEIAELNSEEEV